MDFFITVLTICGLLFPIIDPLGNVFPVQTILDSTSPKQAHLRIIVREIGIAFAILYLSLFGGGALLHFLQIDRGTLQIAGGGLLLIIALSMIFPRESNGTTLSASPFIVPIAVPLIAGPSAISVVILMRGEFSFLVVAVSLLIMAVVTFLIFICGAPIVKVLGQKGSTAIVRLMGLLLSVIAIQMLVNGISSVVLDLNSKIKCQTTSFNQDSDSVRMIP